MEPMTMMAIGSAVAGGLQSIFGGQAQSAAIQRQNEQAYRNWIQSNTQKTFNNSREQFQAAYQTLQQLRRNNAIAKAAWETDYDAKQAATFRAGYQQKQLANQLQTQKSSLLNAMITKGISSSSGMYASMATAQALDAIQNASLIKYNSDMEKRNIDQQTKGMLSQQTQNIFMPNIELYDQAPIFGDSSGAATGGFLSGLVQIGGALGAVALETPKTPKNSNTNSFNPRNNAYTNRTSGGSVGGR
jgi:hypothetical protein